MNTEKLKKPQAQVRIGGKRTPRRKKIFHSTPATDDKKLQSSLKLSVNSIPGIEEVNIINHDGSVIHFNNPKAQASLPTNTFAITCHGENKSISEMLPGILTQLGPQDITQLKKIASEFAANNGAAGFVAGGPSATDDDGPDLVQNFEEIAIGTAVPAAATSPTAADAAESAASSSPDTTAPKNIEEIPVA